MKKLSFISILTVLVLLLGGSFAYARFENQPHNWTDRQRFKDQVQFLEETEFKSGTSSNFESGSAQKFASGSTTTVDSGATEIMNGHLYIGAGGYVQQKPLYSTNDLTYTAGTGWTVTPKMGNVFYLNRGDGAAEEADGDGHESAVTVYLPEPTARYDGWEAHFVNTDSGTTQTEFYAGGHPFESGTTDGLYLDAQFDSATIVQYYVTSAISGYYIKEYRQQ
jgi:hypothetical protein